MTPDEAFARTPGPAELRSSRPRRSERSDCPFCRHHGPHRQAPVTRITPTLRSSHAGPKRGSWRSYQPVRCHRDRPARRSSSTSASSTVSPRLSGVQDGRVDHACDGGSATAPTGGGAYETAWGRAVRAARGWLGPSGAQRVFGPRVAVLGDAPRPLPGAMPCAERVGFAVRAWTTGAEIVGTREPGAGGYAPGLPSVSMPGGSPRAAGRPLDRGTGLQEARGDAGDPHGLKGPFGRPAAPNGSVTRITRSPETLTGENTGASRGVTLRSELRRRAAALARSRVRATSPAGAGGVAARHRVAAPGACPRSGR
jgi:hypothetical protein